MISHSDSIVSAKRSTSYLSTGGMDAYGPIQLLLGGAALHGCTVSLCDLSSVWTQVVKPDDSILTTSAKKIQSLTWHNEGRWCAQQCRRVETVLRCPVCCRWSLRSICCCLCREQWTPEARAGCGTPERTEQEQWGFIGCCVIQAWLHFY